MKLVWDSGGQARIVGMTSDSVSLVSSVPFPPGARPEGTLETGERVRVKVHGSRKKEGEFEVSGRFLDLGRELRERLARSLVR